MSRNERRDPELRARRGLADIHEQRLTKASSHVTPRGSTQTPDIATEAGSASTRIDANPPSSREADPFDDEVLRGLLAAQSTWLAARDAVRLRHQLLTVLIALG